MPEIGKFYPVLSKYDRAPFFNEDGTPWVVWCGQENGPRLNLPRWESEWVATGPDKATFDPMREAWII